MSDGTSHKLEEEEGGALGVDVDPDSQVVDSECNGEQDEHLVDDRDTGYTAPPSGLQLAKPSLEDISEENEGEPGAEVGQSVVAPQGYSEHISPEPSRRPSAKPKSRAGMGSRGRWMGEAPATSESYPNTDSTIYSPGARSTGYGLESPDHWNAPLGSPIRSQWSSPVTSPMVDVNPHTEPSSKSRVQVKDHGPVAKWLAKRTKKSKSAPEKSNKPKGKKPVRPQYAPYIQPKVNTFNPDYQPPPAEPAPILSEKLKWQAKPVVSTHNDYYNPSQGKKTFRVLSEKLHWDPASKVDVWNRDYTPSVSKPFRVFSEKLKWNQYSKIDNHNLMDVPQATAQTEVFHESPSWRSQAKIDTYNRGYAKPHKSDTNVFHETPKWKAQAKVDSVRPFYKPPGEGHIRVKTDRLHWNGKSKVDSYNPVYEEIRSSSQPVHQKPQWSTQVEHKETYGWSSHSSDSETEWLSMSPGGSEKLSPKHTTNHSKGRAQSQQDYSSDQPWPQRRLVYQSKDLLTEEQSIQKRYPFYTPQKGSTANQGHTKPVFTRNKPHLPREPKLEKPKRVFKERTDPLPPIGTYRHKVGEPVEYPENGDYYSPNQKPAHSQKIELIDMKDLPVISKRGRHGVVIN